MDLMITESNEKGQAERIEEIIKRVKIIKPKEALINTLKHERIYKDLNQIKQRGKNRNNQTKTKQSKPKYTS